MPVGVPAWFPSYADAVDTVAGGFEVGAMIIEHPHLIWQGLTEDYVRLWAEGRYAQGITQGALEIGSMFVGVGVAVKIARLADVLTVLKRVEAGSPGDLDRGIQELIEELRDNGEDLNILDEAAEAAGIGGAQVTRNRLAGIDAENFLNDTYGGSQQAYFPTSTGGRYIDNLVDGIAMESKVGRTSLSSRVRNQIAKDVELMNTPGSGVDEIEWHFFTSPTTGNNGPTGPLRTALVDAGINIVIH